MNIENKYEANPLHGVGLKDLLTEMVNYYGFDILFAYLNINCFKNNPDINSSVKFLKKSDWAREKVEAFYMYKFKNLPRASAKQFELSPRDRIVPEGDLPGEPAELSLEDAEELHEKRVKKAAEWEQSEGGQMRSSAIYGAKRDRSPPNDRSDDQRQQNESESPSVSGTPTNDADPWARWKK